MAGEKAKRSKNTSVAKAPTAAKKKRGSRTANAARKPSEITSTKEPPPAEAPAEPARRAHRYGLKVLPTIMTPLVDDSGEPRTPTPHRPVLNTCSICPGFCCTRHEVHLTIPDAVRFCSVLSLPFDAALRFVASSRDEGAFSLDEDPRDPSDARPWTGKVEIALKRTSEGHCVVFHNLDTFGRCGAYAARPSLCRLYPLSWISDLAKGGPISILCPVPYGVTSSQESAFLEDAATAIDYWELHKELVANWEAGPHPQGKDAKQLVQRLFPIAGTRMGIDVSPILDRRSAPQRILAAQIVSLRRSR